MEKDRQVNMLELTVEENTASFHVCIEKELQDAYTELNELQETQETIYAIEPQCDMLDYMLAASSGVVFGLMSSIFLGKAGESKLSKMTDDWFDCRIVDFAKWWGWTEEEKRSPMKYLEEEFKVPYDQRGCGDAGKEVFHLTPSNHHFKSLAHNPTLLGLFFSILDQFQCSSHFISNGELVSLVNVETGVELRGQNGVAKCFCGFVNWFGHLMSDMGGSSGSKGRGMGIPSPLWSWTNDIIALKAKLGISPSQFNKDVNDLALKMYQKGDDLRYQTAKAIPVMLNDMTVRFLYMVRRLLKYLKTTEPKTHTRMLMWQACEPFSNASVKRMLTVSSGTACALNLGSATLCSLCKRPGTDARTEFWMHLNIVGVGYFTFCLYEEAKLAYLRHEKRDDLAVIPAKIRITENYIEGLLELSRFYDDSDLINYEEDYTTSEGCREAFENSVKLARIRKVPEEDILKSREDVIAFFGGGRSDEK